MIRVRLRYERGPSREAGNGRTEPELWQILASEEEWAPGGQSPTPKKRPLHRSHLPLAVKTRFETRVYGVALTAVDR